MSITIVSKASRRPRPRGGRPSADTSPHRHTWLVMHQTNGPSCLGCGASLARIIATDRRAPGLRRENDALHDTFHGFAPMQAA